MFQNRIQNIAPTYDAVIIGGGIVGAGIFRDLALHGIKTLIIDARDFGSQTSSNSSKMFHGGIRYMEGGHFGLVWEALHEKNFWLQNAPHLCHECSFYMPVFGESKYPLWMLRMGLLTYDALSTFKNTPSYAINRKETLKKIPQLKKEGLRGSGVYSDAIVDDGKMTLECIYDGLENKECEALNYTELHDIVPNGQHYQLTIEDNLEGLTRNVDAKHVIFATGPFTDDLLQKFKFLKWKRCMLPSKGIHLWLKRDAIKIDSPMVLQTKDNRVVFVIPHQDSILVGTTEKIVQKDFFDIQADQDEIDYLLGIINSYFPKNKITKKEILSSYAGIRPLVKEGDSKNSTKTSRNHKIFTPTKHVHVIVGGKLTTFRTMGQDISKEIVEEHGFNYQADLTKAPLRKKSLFPAFSKTTPTKDLILKIAKDERVRTFDDLVKRRLGFPNKAHWNGEQEFDDLFLSLKDQLSKFIRISEEDIKKF